jgi:hypothetical protein
VTTTTPSDLRSGCYLYGIVPADAVVPKDLLGIDDAAVTLVPSGEVAAVVSSLDADHTLAGRADLLAHSRVADSFAALGPVIPLRFGAVLQSRDAVEHEVLEPECDRFAVMLGELSGHSQFVVRARYDQRQVLAEIVAENPEIAQLRLALREAPEDSAYSERLRMGELVARALEVKGDADGQTLLGRLERFAAAANLRGGGEPDRLLDVALLIDGRRRDEFEAAVEALAEAFAGRIELTLVGPTAPYDFVEAEQPWA